MLATKLTHSLTRQGRAIVLASSDLHHLQVEKLLGLGQLPGLAEGAPGRPAAGDRSARIINDHLLVLPAGMPSKHP